MLTVLGRGVDIDFSNYVNMNEVIEKMRSEVVWDDSGYIISKTLAHTVTRELRKSERIEVLRNLHIGPHEDDIFRRYFLFYVLEAHEQTLYAADHKVDSKRKCRVRAGERKSLKVKAGDLFVLDAHMEHSMKSPYFRKEIDTQNISDDIMTEMKNKSFFALVLDMKKIPTKEEALAFFDCSKWISRADCKFTE